MKCVVVVVVVLAFAGCQDPPVPVPEARVAALEAQRAPLADRVQALEEQAEPVAPPAPQEVSLIARLGPTFPAPDQIFELTDAERAAYPDHTDGFRLVRANQKDELLIVGSLMITQEPDQTGGVPGDRMHSYSVVLHTRAIDPKNHQIKAVHFGQRQLLGISVDNALEANATTLNELVNGLATKLAAPPGR